MPGGVAGAQSMMTAPYADFGEHSFFVVGTITTVNSKQIIKQLEADGWFLVRVKGSHHQFKHPATEIEGVSSHIPTFWFKWSVP
jgi:predicted RNA binding protein YcfA (HicA-like mRNA interferase family)